jgi:FkbM family methyltransferase
VGLNSSISNSKAPTAFAKGSLSRRVVHRLLHKCSRIQAQMITRTIKFESRFRNDHVLTGTLKTPFCVTTGFDNINWHRSWKTLLIERLFSAENGAFIDVGANVGQTLIDVYSTQPRARYLGFEPNVSCVFYLNQLLDLNSLAGWVVLPVALADAPRCLPLYRHKGDQEDASGTLRDDLRPGASLDADYVVCLRFDDLKCSLGLGAVGFIKIDVEGAELETLLGMKASLEECRPTVLCEVLFTDVNADLVQQRSRNERLMKYLATLKYAVFQLIKSADGLRVLNAKRLDQFPSAYWSRENQDLCDYLCVPEENVSSVLTALLP